MTKQIDLTDGWAREDQRFRDLALGRSKLRSIMDIPAASPKSPCFDIRRRTVLAIRHGLVVMLHADLVDDKYDGSSHEETD